MNHSDYAKSLSPSAYWHLDESSGTNAIDSSGNNKTATYTATPTQHVRGPLVLSSYGANFLPSNSYVLLPSVGAANGTAFSYECWYRTTTTTGVRYLMGEAGSSSNSNNYAFLFINAGRPGFSISDSSGVATTQNGIFGVSFNDGTWHQLVGTCTKGGNLHIYVDGQLFDTGTVAMPAATLTTDHGSIGVQKLLSVFNGYAGDVDISEAAIYPFELTQAQITTLFDNRLSTLNSTEYAGTRLSSWTQPAPLNFSGDWHTAVGVGDITAPGTSADFTTKITSVSSRATLVTTPLRRGNFSVKFTCQSGDNASGGSERTSVAAAGFQYKLGEELWIATSYYLDPTYPNPNPWNVILQMFGLWGVASAGSPPFALELAANPLRWGFTVRGGNKAIDTDLAPFESFNYTDLGLATTGVWHDFLFRIILSKDTKGRAEGWRKLSTDPAFTTLPQVVCSGQPTIITVAGIDMHPYPSIGIYRAAQAQTGIMYTPGVWIRPTRAQAEAFFT